MIVDLASDLARDPTVVGAKAANLARLRAAGLTIAPGFVVCASTWPRDEATDDTASIDTALARVREVAREPAVVVRSCAGDEDGARRSFAGQYLSVVDVRGTDGVVRAIEDVRASLTAPGALAYRNRGGTDTDGVTMHVLVQAMVRPTWSGVGFSADPVGGSGAVIEAVPGHLADLVHGRVVPEHVHVQAGAVVRTPGDHAQELPAPVLARVVALLATVRRELDVEVDVEWAVDAAGDLVVLQARPATSA